MIFESLESRRVLSLSTPASFVAVVNTSGGVVLSWQDVTGETWANGRAD